MKKPFLFPFVLCMSLFALSPSLSFGQVEESEAAEKKDDGISYKKNAVKVNPFGLLTGRLCLDLERALGSKTSLNAGVNLSLVPQSSFAINAMGGGNSIDQFSYSSFGIRPELRFYSGNSIERGFYLGPYVNYREMKMAFASQTTTADNEKNHISFDGGMSSMGGGLQFGAKFRLGQRIFIDWSFLSLGFNVHNIQVTASQEGFTSEEQIENLGFWLQDLPPFLQNKIEVAAGAENVSINTPLFSPSVRSSVTLGIAF